jgi:hypothetical protein
MSNPLISQGLLNRLFTSLSVPLFPFLNVGPSNMGRGMIRMAFEGEATTRIRTATGVTISLEPYQPVVLTVNLLKPQPLASLYKTQFETLTALGDVVVRGDSTLPAYAVFNASLGTVPDLNFNGEDAGFPVTIGGYVLTNASAWL